MDNRFKLARLQYNQHGQQSVKEVASDTGITKSLIDDLESTVSKQRDVGYLKVKKLAEYYGVSSDYLLGLSPTPSVDEDIQVGCKVTGLSQDAISTILESKKYKTISVLDKILSRIDESSKKREIIYLLAKIRGLALLKTDAVEKEFKEVKDFQDDQVIFGMNEYSRYKEKIDLTRFRLSTEFMRMVEIISDELATQPEKYFSDEDIKKCINTIRRETNGRN